MENKKEVWFVICYKDDSHGNPTFYANSFGSQSDANIFFTPRQEYSILLQPKKISGDDKYSSEKKARDYWRGVKRELEGLSADAELTDDQENAKIAIDYYTEHKEEIDKKEKEYEIKEKEAKKIAEEKKAEDERKAEEERKAAEERKKAQESQRSARGTGASWEQQVNDRLDASSGLPRNQSADFGRNNNRPQYSGGPAYYQYGSDDSLYQIRSALSRMSDFDRSNSGEIKKLLNSILSRVDSMSQRLEDVCDGLSQLFQFIKQSNGSLGDYIGEVATPMRSDIKDMKASTETIQGKVSNLESILSAKGVTISRGANPTFDDEKVIVNANNMAKQLIDDLTDAANAYARQFNQNNNAEEVTVSEKVNEQQLSQAQAKGEQSVLLEILGAYSDIDDFCEDEKNKNIVAVMKNHGLEKDSKLKRGDTVSLTSEEVEKLAATAKGVESAGEYVVKKSQWTFGGKIFGAELEKTNASQPES